ncbi:hypothetical protein DKX38_006927 [Salix brachista]|uniref:Uncharacterized protein n=1 Tax=Salix brachista TaxID=2182728 RepID=A0A5N5MM52_9ROSI|nr:hypothetical protein DKX38_006927 [Salix brachista]
MVIICLIVNQGRELYSSQISSLLYATEDVHLWRDNLTRHPLEECIQHWPEKPARYRHVGGAYATEDFQGFLNDLQDWELLKDTDKKMKKKSQASDLIGEDGRSKGKTSTADSSRSGSGQYDYSRSFGAINHLSSSFTTDEVSVDATSEKELGNEYFKRFREAEDDCTEVLNEKNPISAK